MATFTTASLLTDIEVLAIEHFYNITASESLRR
jgi:hypothetical protein